MASTALKFVLLTLALALPIGYFFGSDEYDRIHRIEEIRKAPAFAPAVYEETHATQYKKHVSYRVQFGYEVAGRKYHLSTTSTDQPGAVRYMMDPEQIAYSSDDPSIAIMRRYYDAHHGTMGQSFVVTTILALMLALSIALGLSWKLGWFRRNKTAAKPAPLRKAS